MKTTHKLLIGDSRSTPAIPPESIDLVVTSPPYPMIQMWDSLFSNLSDDARTALENHDGNSAFEAMHIELDRVWRELFRVLKPGAFACVNIGDATRTIGGRFQLYPNHARICSAFRSGGFDTLPVILWRKQTNAPNKFMGSGMLPSGAYVTLEHEYILVFRKGPKRAFKSQKEKDARMESSFFWEERNTWFSDVWDFKGTSQQLTREDVRARSAAYPFELAYRLVNMYSLYGDTVLDPFLGTGTTSLAAMVCARNSVGIEIDDSFTPVVHEQSKVASSVASTLMASRLQAHEDFLAAYTKRKGGTKYRNENHGFPVVTRQETKMQLYGLAGISFDGDNDIDVMYERIGMVSAENMAQVSCPAYTPEQPQQQVLPI